MNSSEQIIIDYYRELDQYKGDLVKNSVAHTEMTFQFAGTPIMDVNTFNGPSKAYYEAFPDLKHSVKEVLFDGERIACKVVAKGTHQGTFQGVEATQKPVIVEALVLFSFDGEKLTSQYTIADMLGLMAQLGAIK